MKKPCRGERTGLKTELKQISLLLFVIFLFNDSYPQIPINGFCKFNSFNVDTDYTSLFPMNFNKDSHTDLLLFNPGEKFLNVLQGGKGGTFGKKMKFHLPYEITKIISISDHSKNVKGYAFISRKNRRMGIYDFTKQGRPYLKKIFKFDSYPENISSANLNNKGSESYLISGSAFNGLSILSEVKNRFKEKKIAANVSYTNALFVDLNNDGYPDIAAYNLLDRTLDFYENSSKGEFRKVRSVNIEGRINSLQSFDVNLDDYQDLVYALDNSVNIIYGDSVSSYQNKITVETLYHPDKIVLADFNRDGKIDIAYINRKNEILSVIFAKSSYEFYPEIIYLKKQGLSGIIPYYSKFINGIAMVSTKGFVYSVTSLAYRQAGLSSMAGDVDISLGADPGALSFFDMDNNGIIDFCFVDNFNNTLKLVIRNNAGVPALLYSTNLFENEKKITVDNYNPKVKTFYCYNIDKKLIEVVSYNFSDGKVDRSSLYTSGKIKDVKILSRANDNTKVFAVYLKDGNLGLSEYVHNGFRYNTSDYTDIASNVIAANIAVIKTIQIFYWQKMNDKQSLYRVSLSDNFKNPVRYFQVPVNGSVMVNSFAGDLFNKDEAVSINFFESARGSYAVLSSGNSPSVIVSKDLLNHFRIKNKNQLFFGEMKPGGLKKLFIYVPGEGALHKIDFINKGREIVITKVLDARHVDSYFVKNMNYKDYHFVYSDPVDGCIKIKQISR